jgi:hypothetical protein
MSITSAQVMQLHSKFSELTIIALEDKKIMTELLRRIAEQLSQYETLTVTALPDLEHLKEDIILRSKMQEDYQEGEVFVGFSAWFGLCNTIDVLKGIKSL